ncbi:hypothetical protein [Porphyromonas sp. COT-239 OH1446]|uniref:hypothetical protein n=1 Tax=Porphyromonas sp. COT-239 OH1446 TaxID=1515613 RepID=UPI00052E34A2|nr:hypothetical protein [Porphyromonas sp. COT-239 OH1446]KGN71316.1 hypothetical protein HQ37_02400 [Porphyromonas sp. COT-239 OH1446]
METNKERSKVIDYTAPKIDIIELKVLPLLQAYSTHQISDQCVGFENMVEGEEWISDPEADTF